MAPGTRIHRTLAAASALLLAACEQQPPVPTSMRVVEADPARGAQLVRQYGCTACHQIPGVRAVGGGVGPPLGGLVHRAYIAGSLTNRPETVMRFIADAPSLSPGTAMPNMGITLGEARDITAFLYQSRGQPR